MGARGRGGIRGEAAQGRGMKTASPHPAAFAATLSLRERDAAATTGCPFSLRETVARSAG